jgi:hypothetical protein
MGGDIRRAIIYNFNSDVDYGTGMAGYHDNGGVENVFWFYYDCINHYLGGIDCRDYDRSLFPWLWPCDWPGCSVESLDRDMTFYLRYYLWIPEGFFCPEHTAFIEEGKRTGYFKDWPRDMSPKVLEMLDAMRSCVSLESERGQRIVRDIDAHARRAEFHICDE